jgi:maltooligosyltrehalose trehalohydrolase
MTWQRTLGAIPLGRGEGTSFCVWAPDARDLELVVEPPDGLRPTAMRRDGDGYFRLVHREAGPGTRYRYLVDGRGPFPDPASRYQPLGVHGPSQVVDPSAFTWHDRDWRGVPIETLVLYELHVGTFTPEGTFRSATDRLRWLAELGITAVELMPVADFPGDRNWGYDGVAPFAPARCYGTPDELRAFVDAAHGLGLAVHLDVVYNHFGPDGAYQGAFSRGYYSEVHSSPWGQGINFDGPGSAEVRKYVVENALHWVHEYHIDGLRLDATHAIVDDGARHIVAEVAEAVHGAGGARGCTPLVIAEDHRNLATMIRHGDGGWGLDAVWSDDFHHQLRVALTGDRDGYFADFGGTDPEIATTVRDGWFYRGQYSTYFEARRGTDPAALPLARFVAFAQNHDQAGNRACGERLSHDVDPAVYRAVAVLLLMLPETPLLFMGQEWAATTPFLYFTAHNEELGRAVTAGRRREFRRFARFASDEAAARIPDPQAQGTFDASRLRWDELGHAPHAGALALHRRLLALRRTEPALRRMERSGEAMVTATDDGAIIIRREAEDGRVLVACVRLRGGGSASPGIPPSGGSWTVVLSSEDEEFAVDGARPSVVNPGPVVWFERPGAIVFSSSGARRA